MFLVHFPINFYTYTNNMMNIKNIVILVCFILCDLCESNKINDANKTARGILGGSLPKWRGYVKKAYPDQKPEPRFWPPVHKESRCK